MTNKKRVNCYKCEYLYVTWDPKNPRGCKYFGFKSKLLPSIVVFRSSGKRCEAFKAKSTYLK